MKVKTSITLSEQLLKALEQVAESVNRSELIEQAVWQFLQKRAVELREEKDLKILNDQAARHEREAKDVLSYQVKL